jgi:hypothetical protein
MTEIHAKPIIEGKYWIVEQNGEKIGTLQKKENNKFMLSGKDGSSFFGKKEELLKVAKQVADSRIILGVHYKSDNLFGFQIVKELLLKDDIKEKYFPNV